MRSALGIASVTLILKSLLDNTLAESAAPSERAAVLAGDALLMECDDPEWGAPAQAAALARLLDALRAPAFVASQERRALAGRAMLSLEVRKPTRAEQGALWRATLGEAEAGLNGRVERLTAHFHLSASAIGAACAEALAAGPAPAEAPGERLWRACPTQARPRLDDLAQRIAPAADWDGLVLPEAQRVVPRDIAVHMRQRVRVYDEWGFGARGGGGWGSARSSPARPGRARRWRRRCWPTSYGWTSTAGAARATASPA